MPEKKRGLGRGFDALIPTAMVDAEFDVTAPSASGGTNVAELLRELPIEIIDPNPHQPRTEFNVTELEALAASIRVHGILQPLVVTKAGARFELVAGERRLRASKLAGLDTVPAIVRSFDEQQKLELALIENLQRSDLNPIETATAYRKLTDQFNMSLAQISERVGRDISTVSNSMRLLNLSLEAKRAIVEGVITEGHGRAILSIREMDKRDDLLALIFRNHWNVRQAEEYARAFKGTTGSHEKAKARIALTNDLTRSLGDYLGTKVIQKASAKGGKLVIEYYSEEELDRIYRAIKGNLDI